MAAACPHVTVTEKTIILPESQSNGHEANYRLTLMAPKRRYLSYLRERWWATLICVTLAVAGTLAFETLRKEGFVSYAQLYLNGVTQVNNLASLFSEESLTYFGTQIEFLKSSRLQAEAMEKAGIVVKPGEKSPVKLDVVQPLKTSILQLQANGPPEKVQAYLQALVEGYRAYKKEIRDVTTADVVLSLTEELAKRETLLREEQEKWAAFQKTNNVAVLEEDAKSAGTYLNELTLRLAKLKLDQRLLTNGLVLASGPGSVFASQVQDAEAKSSNPALIESQMRLERARLDLVTAMVDKDNPAAGMKREYDRDVARKENTVKMLEKEYLTEKAAMIRELETQITALGEAIPPQESHLLSLNERLSEGQRLKDNVARQQANYDHLLATLQNVDLSKTVQQERLSILLPATAAQPEKRYLPLRIALSLVGGLLLSLGIVFVWYLLDDRFVSVRDIKDQFGETVLGLVPEIKVSRKKPERALLASADSRFAYLESYRHLRSALLLSSVKENQPQTLLITSALPAEGKTTVAVNLARLLAQVGLRVVLVDADAHGGGMNRLLPGNDQLGVSDYLRGSLKAEAIIHSTEVDGLAYVPRGTDQEHSEGLFVGTKLRDLIRELRQNRDFVMIDAAPILASDNAAMLVPHADVVVVVTRPFYTRSRMVRQALDMLYQRQAKQVNIVLNRARSDDLAGHYAKNGLTRSAKNGKAKNH